MSGLSMRARRFVKAATLLFGDRWQSPAARALKVSQGLLQKIAAGDRAVTNDIDGRMADLISAELKARDKAAIALSKILAEIDNERGA